MYMHHRKSAYYILIDYHIKCVQNISNPNIKNDNNKTFE